MAQVANNPGRSGTQTADPLGGDPALAAQSLVSSRDSVDQDKVLPLPGWLKRAYFIFPVVLYIPDALFNYYVYSDGIKTQSTNPAIQAAYTGLWLFLAIGVVGMAYLLSVLAPWHWGQGHRIQAFFCGVGVIVATAITTWNSLAYRSQHFASFPTDDWVWQIWPQLKSANISITMILVAIAPPFWGLFWAIVQPTETGRSLRQLQESHAERLMRVQQEAELKRIKAETSARIREAQLRGMAQTAAAAREQARGLFTKHDEDGEPLAIEAPQSGAAAMNEAGAETTDDEVSPNSGPLGVVSLPTFTSARESNASRGPTMHNHAAATTPAVHSAPAGSLPISQPALLHGADVLGMSNTSAAGLKPRTPPVVGRSVTDTLFSPDVQDVDGATGTTGPHAALRRPGDSHILRTLNEPPIMSLVRETHRELTANGKKVPQRDLIAAVAQRANLDEASARSAVRRWRETQGSGRN
jgi:hypothetical protein